MDPTIDRAISIAAALCPSDNASTSSMIQSVYNTTEFADRDHQLATFACLYADSVRLMDTLDYWNGSTYIFGFLLGVPSAILALLAFSRQEFDTISFYYHRVINVIELFYMGFVFEFALQWMTGELNRRSYAWARFQTVFHYKLDMALPMANSFIIVWVAIERVTICFAPVRFNRVNRRTVAYPIVVGCVIVAIGLYTPLAFTTNIIFNNDTSLYERRPTEFAMNPSFDAYVYFLGGLTFAQLAAMTAATIGTLAGLVQNSRRKRRLVESAGAKSVNAKQLLQQINVNRQLCLLQLCESVPILLNCLILVWMQVAKYTFDPDALASMPYDEAQSNVAQFRRSLYLSISQTVVDLLEHSTHFYRYYFFSNKVKDTTRSLFRRNTVSSISIMVT